VKRHLETNLANLLLTIIKAKSKRKGELIWLRWRSQLMVPKPAALSQL
jgi:hypothetical protein